VDITTLGGSSLWGGAALSQTAAEAAERERRAKLERERAAGKAAKSALSFRNLLEPRPAAASDEALPAGEPSEVQAALLDEVHESGDALSKRPFPEEIKRYKASVRRFMRFVVDNALGVETRRGRRGSILRGTEDKIHTTLTIVDAKLERLAADLLSGQADRLALLARIDEINGLLVDLVS